MIRNVAFVTCSRKPGITEDDGLLAAAMGNQGCVVRGIPWDDKTIQWTDFDLIVLRSCWDYHLRSDEFSEWVERMQRSGVRFINDPQIVLWNINKKYLFELEKSGVPIPKGIFVAKGDVKTLHREVKVLRAERLVVKPAVSATAYKTQVVYRDELLKDESMLNELFAHGDVIVQEFIEEIQTQGEISLLYFGGEFSHAVLKQAKRGDFRVQGDFGGTVVPFVPSESLIEQTDSIIQKVPGALYARVDGVEINRKFVLMELELIEPVLFFAHSSSAPEKLATLLLR